MSDEQSVSRRSILKGAAAGAGVILAQGVLSGARAAEAGKKEDATVKTYKNEDFYANGVFQKDKALQAYFDMMDRFKYPIVPRLKDPKDGMWVLDFACGDFVHAGMGGIFWWNDLENGYFGHEIFLLPGQMIVEHGHVKTAKAKPKMEAWHVRHGMIYTFGEGEATEPCPVTLPESQKKFITCKKAKKVMPGEIDSLNRAEAKHFMYAGPEGAIVTEYATYHDGDGLRFTNTGVKL
ncbi:MAG: hypothetical protein NTX50_09560 [Candidatus Sumerlaeota bacterium]|nr:hypothetical protein [Candidatus Sumerlaeota bacterium]